MSRNGVIYPVIGIICYGVEFFLSKYYYYIEIQAHGCLIAAINAHSWALHGERDGPAVGREFEEDPLFRFSSSLFFPRLPWTSHYFSPSTMDDVDDCIPAVISFVSQSSGSDGLDDDLGRQSGDVRLPPVDDGVMIITMMLFPPQ